MKRLLLFLLVALVIVPTAFATATTTYNVYATSTRASVTTWTTNRSGNLTMTLRYTGKGSVAFNLWATSDGASLGGLCVTTSGPGFVSYSCAGAPASGYEAMIWPSRATLSGTLTVVGETD